MISDADSSESYWLLHKDPASAIHSYLNLFMQFMLHLQLPLHGFSNLQASNNRSQNQQKLLCWTLNTCYDSLEKKILMFISYSLIWKWFLSKFSQQT